jgi:hypothetical protein
MKNIKNEIFFDKTINFIPDENYFPYSKNQINIFGNDLGASQFMKKKYEKDLTKNWVKYNLNLLYFVILNIILIL